MAKLPAHGTRYRYNHRTAACRCARCRRANAAYVAAWKANRLHVPHVYDVTTTSGRTITVVQPSLWA